MTSKILGLNLHRGKIALAERDFSLAIAYFSKAIIEEDVNNVENWCLLAESLFYLGAFDCSLHCWKTAAKKNPASRKIWTKISALYALLNQPKKAIKFYKVANNFPFMS
ncbi:MAG: hypothetical protein U9O98_03085 [Asgard group archaeon]|nr:hypothetical protein [Asgard group archaeon]